MTERECTLCHETKPMSQFSKGNAKGGYKSFCKACQLEMTRTYRARLKTTERPTLETKLCGACHQTKPSDEFYKHSGTKDGYEWCCKACTRPHLHRWYIKNATLVLTRKRRWNSENKAQKRRAAQAWRGRNRFRDRQINMRYYLRKKGNTIGPVDYDVIWERDQGICYLCNQAIDRSEVHFDHVIPVSKGGPHTMDNIRATHARCNLQKHDKLITKDCT